MWICHSDVNESTLECKECKMKYKKEIERGIKVIGIDYSSDGTKNALSKFEEV